MLATQYWSLFQYHQVDRVVARCLPDHQAILHAKNTLNESEVTEIGLGPIANEPGC